MIAAVGSVLLTPWNWYDNAHAIHYTLGVLGALIGPLFGILIAGYYLDRQAARRASTTCSRCRRRGRYWYSGGYNRNAVATVLVAGLLSVSTAVLPKAFADMGAFDVTWIASYAWFIGCGLGYGIFVFLERRNPQIPVLDASDEHVSDGTVAERTGVGAEV